MLKGSLMVADVLQHIRADDGIKCIGKERLGRRILRVPYLSG
jgi:hypothetical protein